MNMFTLSLACSFALARILALVLIIVFGLALISAVILVLGITRALASVRVLAIRTTPVPITRPAFPYSYSFSQQCPLSPTPASSYSRSFSYSCWPWHPGLTDLRNPGRQGKRMAVAFGPRVNDLLPHGHSRTNRECDDEQDYSNDCNHVALGAGVTRCPLTLAAIINTFA